MISLEMLLIVFWIKYKEKEYILDGTNLNNKRLTVNS